MSKFNPNITSKKSVLAGLLLTMVSGFSQATVVDIQTSMGTIQVNLFDNTTPQTVANFLNYVNSGAYVNNVVHRVEPKFVVQAGGFQYNDEFPLDNVKTGTPVINEPKLSNLRGTIAMAKSSGNVNSATSQWFFNLSDNSANLDKQNGGFTVFGQVIGDGMKVVDAIAALNRFNLGGAATSMPLKNYSSTDADNNVDVTKQNLVLIADVVVVDGAKTTHPEIVPVKNTLITTVNSDNGSGGAFGWLSLLSLVVLAFRRKFQ